MGGDAGSVAGDVAALEVESGEDRLVAALVGDIDIACSADVEAGLAAELERGSQLVVLDLSRTTYLDSSGIRMIFSLARSLQAQQRELRVVVSDEAIVRRVVILSRLDAAVRIFPTLDAALSPPEELVSWSWAFPPTHASARIARDVVRGALWEAGVSDASVEEAVLAANELVTNAILHARTDCTLRLFVDTDIVRVEVEDRDPSHLSPVVLGPDAGSGRGLVLVERLAAEWGHELLPDGKIVWCEVHRPVDAS
jgi:anti-anti-sigma factor